MKNSGKGQSIEELPKKGKQVDMGAYSEAAYERNDRIAREDRSKAPTEDLEDEKKLKKKP